MGWGGGGSDGAVGSFLGTWQLCPSTTEALQGHMCDTVRRSMHRCAHTHMGFSVSLRRTQCHSQQGPCPGLQGWSVVVQARNPPSPPAWGEPHATTGAALFRAP